MKKEKGCQTIMKRQSRKITETGIPNSIHTRRIIKNNPSFTNDDSLRKMLYLVSKKIVKHWTCRCRNWDFGLISSTSCFPIDWQSDCLYKLEFPQICVGIYASRAYLGSFKENRTIRSKSKNI